MTNTSTPLPQDLPAYNIISTWQSRSALRELARLNRILTDPFVQVILRRREGVLSQVHSFVTENVVDFVSLRN